MEFERLEILLGDKLKGLRALRVLVLGVGGVGSYAVEALARMGINNLILVDYDKIDITNINRQIMALHSSIGLSKVAELKKRILDINPQCVVTTLPVFYDEKTSHLLEDYKIDYILDCCDSLKSKELIIRYAVSRNIKIISSMGAGYKLDPTKIVLAKLKNTSYDKLAKVLRGRLKDDKRCLEIPVVYSKEEWQNREKTIGSVSFIPSIFGLYMASFVLNDYFQKIS